MYLEHLHKVELDYDYVTILVEDSNSYTVHKDSVLKIWLFNRMLYCNDYVVKDGKPVLVIKTIPNLANHSKCHMLEVLGDELKIALPYILDTSKIIHLRKELLLTVLKTVFYFGMFHVLQKFYNIFLQLVDSTNIASLYYLLRSHCLENSNLYCMIKGKLQSDVNISIREINQYLPFQKPPAKFKLWRLFVRDKYRANSYKYQSPQTTKVVARCLICDGDIMLKMITNHKQITYISFLSKVDKCYCCKEAFWHHSCYKAFKRQILSDYSCPLCHVLFKPCRKNLVISKEVNVDICPFVQAHYVQQCPSVATSLLLNYCE